MTQTATSLQNVKHRLLAVQEALSFKKSFIKYSAFFLLMVSLGLLQNTFSQQTDEYGSGFENRVLGNLSAAGRYGLVPHDFTLNQNLQGTVEAWVYLTAYNDNSSYIYQKGSSFIFAVGSSVISNRPFLALSSYPYYPLSGSSVPLNRWVHLAATWLQSGALTTVTFYMDGQIIGTPVTGSTGVSSNTQPVTIGGSLTDPPSFVSGSIDEVRYWSRLRTASEIAVSRFVGIGDALVANQNSALVSSASYSGLVSSWTFNANSSSFQDNISLRHGTYTGGASSLPVNISGQPIPYNLALLFPGGANDYIRIPDNNIFDRTVSGTFDGWILPNNGNGTIISKGASPGDMTFRVYLSGGNLNFAIGAFSVSGPAVQLNSWNHIAVTWKFNGAMCTMRYYVNGTPSGPAVNTITMGINSNPVIIGNSQLTNSPFNGYMDELRLWNRDLTADEIKSYMFASSRRISGFSETNLLACWNFEGNLNNLTTVPEINATFNIGTTNNCRFSGYWNENVTGEITSSYVAHCTAINRRDGDNEFPTEYNIRAPHKNLFYNVSTYDTINIPNSAALSEIEVFLHINQPYINNTVVTLTAPNGQIRTLLSNNGGGGGGALTFLKDGNPSLNSFNNPWSYLAASNQPMGTFNNTNVQGRWILKITNGAMGFTGRLLGWGLKINSVPTGIQQVNGNIPNEFMLYQNYPNPFNPSTNIRFDIPKDSDVKLTLYDMLGREVKILADEYKNSGSYELNFDASALSSGMYFYKLTAGNFTEIKKMILVK